MQPDAQQEVTRLTQKRPGAAGHYNRHLIHCYTLSPILSISATATRMKRPIQYLILLLAGCLITACNKTVVNFGDQNLTDDPNIIYLDSFTLKLATYQADSFSTVSDSLFRVGRNADSLFGVYTAQSWFQVGIPAANPLSGCTSCSFDSLVFMTRFQGAYYGDTTQPFKMELHRLTQQINTDYGSVGFNISHFDFDPTAMASVTVSTPRPSLRQALVLRLPDDLGNDFFNKLKRNSDTISDQDKFVRFFKGLVLRGADESNKSVYYFNLYNDSIPGTVRLYYRINGSAPQQNYVDFTLQPPAFQFNSFTYDKTGTPLAAFQPQKKQNITANLTGNKAFLHAGSGLYPRITLPDVFSLKELHPYIKIVKASLEITPPSNSYGLTSMYLLPPTLGLYPIDDANATGSGITLSDGSLQTGNLVIDYLYHKDTRYSYDLTAYINTMLTTGRTAQRDLLLFSLNNIIENRLILYATGQDMSVKLKLYVLGL